MKKLLILFICINISLMPLISISNISYADSQPSPSWVYVTQQDDEPERTVVIGAVKAYLGARGYNNIFTYSAEKAIVQWSYNNWDNMARRKGYNGLSDLNNHIAYRYNNDGKLQFFLDDSSIEMMNQMYTAFLEYYNITENTSKQLYNGEWFEDDDGNGCYVFNVSSLSASDYYTNIDNYINTIGTRFILQPGYYYKDLIIDSDDKILFPSNPIATDSFTYNQTTFTITLNALYNTYSDGDFIRVESQGSSCSSYLFYTPYIASNGNHYGDKKTIDTDMGIITIFKYNNKYYYGVFNKYQESNSNKFTYQAKWQLNNASAINAAVAAAQAGMNAGIVAAGKSAAITTGKDGLNALKDYLEDNDSTDDDVVTPVDEPTPPDDPSGGTPPGYNNTGGALTPDGNGGFNFNFKMPNLNIDWNLGLNVNNLPFPFSIPFDFNNALKMLNVEPETPRFQGTIHVPYINYDWEIDLDFGKYDEYETLINMFQKVLLFGYVISLILATRAVMHIY